MKKFLILLMISFISFEVFSAKTICIIPYNKQISDFIKGYFPDEDITLKKSDSDISVESLLTGDRRLFEYINRKVDADLMILPILENVSGFTYKRIFVYKDNELNKVYESLDNKEPFFNDEVILDILPYISDGKMGMIRFEAIEPNVTVNIDSEPAVLFNDSILLTEGTHSAVFNSGSYTSKKIALNVEKNKINSIRLNYKTPSYHNLKINSPLKTEVFSEGKSLGFTPLVIKSYKLPLVLRFHADGYSDKTVSITEPSDSLNVKLNILDLSDSDTFKKNQKKFYNSFIRNLLLFGTLPVVRGSELLNENNTEIAEKIIKAGLAVSLADFGFNLVRYYRSIKNTAP